MFLRLGVSETGWRVILFWIAISVVASVALIILLNLPFLFLG